MFWEFEFKSIACITFRFLKHVGYVHISDVNYIILCSWNFTKKRCEKMIQIKDNFQIQNNFRVRSSHHFFISHHLIRLNEAVLNFAKVLLFVCENFRIHNLRFRISLYLFILETPVMSLLNTIGRNSVKSVIHVTLEKPDSNSEGLISLKKWLLSLKHGALQSKSNFSLESITLCTFSLNCFWSKFLS